MEELKETRKSFALVLRGEPEDFMSLVSQAKAAGLYIVFTKTSNHRLFVEERPW